MIETTDAAGRPLALPASLGPQQTLVLRHDDWTAGRYLFADLTYRGPHHAMLQVLVYADGEAEPRSRTMMGYYPDVACRFVLDLTWLDGQRVFFPRTPGRLKATSFTRRIQSDEIGRIELMLLPSEHEQSIELGPFQLTADEPDYPVADLKLIDSLGQHARGDWPGKTDDEANLIENLTKLRDEGDPDLPEAWPDTWSTYGGDKCERFDATGFFRAEQRDDRWYIIDPKGHPFFSAGLDCVRPGDRPRHRTPARMVARIRRTIHRGDQARRPASQVLRLRHRQPHPRVR
jgi:hypothetical protein